MKILWLINIPLPEASNLMSEDSTPFGGWLVNASTAIARQNEIELSIAFPHKKSKKVTILEGKEVEYHLFPPVDYRYTNQINQNEYLEEILNSVKPDLVHIFGTEYTHTLSMVNICKKRNVKTVISIQGLVSVYAQHYMAFLPINAQKNSTIRDFLKRDNLIMQQKKFIKRGKFEIEAIQKVNHVIGRTTWDKACTAQINPDIRYHFCNETLRDAFYENNWNIEKCEKYSIFVSQGSYPIKGLHIMLEAMPLILRVYPNSKLYIGGPNIFTSNTIKQKLLSSTYANYIKKLIKKLRLENNIEFTGLLDEKEMCERYLKSNLFVSASAIENSPNSLGEAMILGVPCVASNVGGTTDMLQHERDGFIFQSDAPYMLAYYACKIFKNKDLALMFSKNAKVHAEKTHNQNDNLYQLLGIYKEIKNAAN